MPSSATVIDQLRRRGELWEPAPGMVSLRGAAARLRTALETELAALCAAETPEEWHVPPAVPFGTLARADYFATFPQWLTAVAHLDTEEGELARIAGARDAAAAAVGALLPVPLALQPAVCYHVYAALAGQNIGTGHCCTAAGTCWRHEAGRLAALERGWAFTMREVVRTGDAGAISAFRERGVEAGIHLAMRLGLRPRIAQATDPFFAAGNRGRALIQRMKALKHELLLPLGDGRSTAAASFNDHGTFFGTAFDIRLGDGSCAATGCVAFGIERWLLAVLVEHGTAACDWPLDVNRQPLDQAQRGPIARRST